ncbi:MAG: response regulator, partial [Thermodesulfobacteriota bacterium]
DPDYPFAFLATYAPGLTAGARVQYQPLSKALREYAGAKDKKTLIKLLSPFDFDLREAANGQEAIDIARTWKPHLIWMDMRMPVVDGYVATRRIRTLPSDAVHPVIVAVTASVFEENREEVISTCAASARKRARETSSSNLTVRRT